MDIELIRTDSEGDLTPFRKRILQELGIVDLQGLWIGDNEAFTQALEAFDVKSSNRCIHLSDLFNDEEILAKAIVANKLGIPFSIWVHYPFLEKGGERLSNVFECRRIAIDEKSAKGFTVIGPNYYNEQAFISWFTKNKKTNQVKKFSETEHIDNYFDNLVRSRHLRWGGNIDGILFDRNSRTISAIIEIRCTQYKKIEEYDPASFYKGTRNKPEGDYNTWKPVMTVAEQLGVPCFLMTFPKYDNTELFGITVVDRQDHEGLYYRDNKPPYETLLKTSDEAEKYIRAAIGRHA